MSDSTSKKSASKNFKSNLQHLIIIVNNIFTVKFLIQKHF